MPNRDASLLPEEFQRLRDRLKAARAAGSLEGKHLCPYCRNDEWLIGQHIVVDEIPDTTLDPGETPFTVPYVAMFCSRCGYTMRFNAMVLSLFNEEGQQVTSMQTSSPEVKHGR